MASLAASRAAASLGVSEMLGNPLNFSGATRSASPAASTPATFKTVALFSKKKPAPKPKPSAVSPADVELAKWYGKWSIHLSVHPLFFNLVKLSSICLKKMLFLWWFQVLTEESSCRMGSWTGLRSQNTWLEKSLESKITFLALYLNWILVIIPLNYNYGF